MQKQKTKYAHTGGARFEIEHLKEESRFSPHQLSHQVAPSLLSHIAFDIG